MRDMSWRAMLSILVPTVLSQAVTSPDGFIEKLLAENRNPLPEYMGAGLMDCSMDYMRTMAKIKGYLREEAQLQHKLGLDGGLGEGNRVFSDSHRPHTHLQQQQQRKTLTVPLELSAKLMDIMDTCDQKLLQSPAAAEPQAGGGWGKMLSRFHDHNGKTKPEKPTEQPITTNLREIEARR